MSSGVHPLSGGSLRNLLNIALSYGVDRRYLGCFLSTVLFSAAFGPSRAVSKVLNAKKVDRYSLSDEPVFILGHWRSGTTYLHHLMSQDSRFSYVSSYQAAVPELFLQDTAFQRSLVASNLPQKRPMDNIELSLQKPEEEEVLMANTCSLSYIHTFSFPKQARKIFRQSLLFEGVSRKQVRDWETQYVRAVKIACIGQDAHRPLLKSPGNTARIRTLLKLFPNAKFVHIYRNPYVVYSSMIYAYQKLMGAWAFQDIGAAEVEANVLEGYEQLMQRYFQDCSLIPQGNLVEVRYEDLESRPLDVLKGIYEDLGISEFSVWESEFQRCVDSVSGYQKNTHRLSSDTVAKLRSRWGFTIDKWGYGVPEMSQPEASISNAVR